MQIINQDFETLQELVDIDDDNEPSPGNVPVENQVIFDKNGNQNKSLIFG